MGQFPPLFLLQLRLLEGRRAGHVPARLWRPLSQPFRIADDVYARGAWQPTLEYFLPVQMCHMRVNEKYRVWHGVDHVDDARMAPINLDHIDGYAQGPSTLTRFKPGEHVPGLDAGGWHDAGDYDLRVESQIGTVWLLAKMVEEFGLDYDATSIDETRKIVEIHQPDGKNDALQQIEHGLLSILGGYRAMGRVYRGIQDVSLRQYVMLGEAANATDNVPMKRAEGLGVDNNGQPITIDDRWVFTEENPQRELYVAGGLAAAARVLKASNPAMAAESLAAARHLYAGAIDKTDDVAMRVFALAELIRTTGDAALVRKLVALEPAILAQGGRHRLGDRADPRPHPGRRLQAKARRRGRHLPGERPGIGARRIRLMACPTSRTSGAPAGTYRSAASANIISTRAGPTSRRPTRYINALNFDLGVHPGENNESFATGVGAHSATMAYGFNRADWSAIPGGVVSGTALIRPDLPELKEWPFFWQQREYVMGGGETNYMFLALAADALYRKGRP